MAAKYASQQSFGSLRFLLFYGVSLGLLFVFAILWQQILKVYDLMVAYAWKGMSFLWAFLWAVFLFEERITLTNIAGAAMIVVGMMLVHREE